MNDCQQTNEVYCCSNKIIINNISLDIINQNHTKIVKNLKIILSKVTQKLRIVSLKKRGFRESTMLSSNTYSDNI